MKVNQFTLTSGAKFGILVIGLVHLLVSGCSTDSNRAQRVKMQQESAAEQSRKRNEEALDFFRAMADNCEKNGLQKIIIEYDNGTSLLCVSDYNKCVESVLDFFKQKKFNSPLSYKEKEAKATKFCRKGFPEQESEPSKLDAPIFQPPNQ